MPFYKLHILCVSTQNWTHIEFKFHISSLATSQQHVFTLNGININCLISAARCKILPLKISSFRPVNRFHLILMILQLLDACEINRISVFIKFLSPNADCPIKTCTCKKSTLGTPWQIPYCFRVNLIECTDAYPFG